MKPEIKFDVGTYSQFYETAFGKTIVRAESEIIKDYLGDCAHILDIGCGYGIFERALPDFPILGIDASFEMIRQAKKKGGAFLQGKAENLPFSNLSFDCVFFVTSLEFMDDYKKVLDEALRVLAKSEKLLILLLNRESQYFADHYVKPYSIFRKAQVISPQEVKLFLQERNLLVDIEYAIGIEKDKVFDTPDPELNSIVVVKAARRGSL